jgi:hypothetical protein
MDAFSELGDKIEAAWCDADFSEEKFPSIAAEFLRNEGMPSKVTAWEVLEWGLRQIQMPRQMDVHASFGDPPITLYTAPKFHIDVYFWFDGTTSIHQHGFCGAFQVLHGSSIHSWYDFELKEKINVFTEIGDIRLKTCELLDTGAVQEIWPGRRYIHGLFHLDSPSATICVRTTKSPLSPPQFNYHKPSLATDPFFEDETLTKKIQMMSAMLRAKRTDADEHIKLLLAGSDFQSTFSILSFLKRAIHSDRIDQLFALTTPTDRFNKFMDVARMRHGDKADVFTGVFAHNDKLNEIVRRRGFVTDPEHRFFFALLLNVEGKERIFALIKQRYPDVEPHEKILDWVFDLSQTRVVGSNQQNALGIDPIDDLDLMIFEGLLRDRLPEEIIASIEAEYPAEKFAVVKEGLSERISKTKNAVIFGPLFS